MYERITRDYDPELFSILCKENERGIWLQASRTIQKDTTQHHILLYDYFKENTYTVDEGIIGDYKRLQPWLFNRYPL